MKVFISWSGELSHKVACAFRDWLPAVIQSVHPYVSSEDIDKGTRWSTDIAKELDEASYGIICVTKDNLNAPWVSFEAGALSKIIDKSNVSPFLFNIKRSDVQGPLLQFQSTIYEMGDVFKLVKSINKRIDQTHQLTDEQVRRAFEVWWPQLDEKLKAIPNAPVSPKSDKPENKTLAILEEVLELSRRQHRILNDPEALLPAEYLQYTLGSTARISGRHELPEIVHENLLRLRDLLLSLCSEKFANDRTRMAASLVEDILEYFHSTMRRPPTSHSRADKSLDKVFFKDSIAMRKGAIDKNE